MIAPGVFNGMFRKFFFITTVVTLLLMDARSYYLILTVVMDHFTFVRLLRHR